MAELAPGVPAPGPFPGAPLVASRAEFAGYETRVLESTGQGTPVLFFHGYGDSADTWRLAMDGLRRRGTPAYAVDLPGFGGADRLSREPILPQLDAFARAAVEHVARRSGGSVLVAGNSLGGCVALRLAERPDGPLAGVVAVAPAGLDMGRWLAIIEGEYILRWLLASPVPIPDSAVRAVVSRLYRALVFADRGAATDEVVERFVSHYRDLRTVRRYLAVARAMMTELRDPFELHRIECPVLVVWGTRDRMVYPSGADRITANVAGARVELLDGCGHCPQVEEPRRFVDILSAFHTEVTGTARLQ